MHIAIVNQHSADMLGGSEIQCDIIARTLASRGHRVDYLAVGGSSSTNYPTEYCVHPVERKAEAIANAALALNPAIIYWRFNKHCFAAAAARIRRAGIPIVFSVSHVRDVSRFYIQPNILRDKGLNAFRRALKESWRLMREHNGFNFVDALVSNNPDNLGKVSVPIQSYIPNSMEPRTVPFSWPRPYCVWVANIKDRKQPEKYVELATRLLDQDVDFLMVGQLQSKSYTQLLAKDTGNFHYLGEKRIDEVNGILAGSLFLVHTCHPEGFSNNFIQAWQQGRAVISLAFDPGGLLENEGLGLFSRGSMDTFAQQTRDLIRNPAMANDIGRRAQEYAAKNFSPEANVARLEVLLETVIKSASGQK